jgi:hypothetical protein
MSVIKTDGTENRRANPKVKHAEGDRSPSGSGKDLGGTENLRADAKVMGPTVRPNPTTYAQDHRPAGVVSFKESV